MNNLSPFYIDQKVVYITGINLPKGSIFTVKGCILLSCGCWKIDIGLTRTFYTTLCCNDHNNKILLNSTIRYFDSNSFRPLIEERFHLIEYSKVIEEIPACAN